MCWVMKGVLREHSVVFVYGTMEDGEGFSREVSCGVFDAIFVCSCLDGLMGFYKDGNERNRVKIGFAWGGKVGCRGMQEHE